MKVSLTPQPRFSSFRHWGLGGRALVNVQTSRGVVQMTVSDLDRQLRRNGNQDPEPPWKRKLKQLLAKLFNWPNPQL